jgi:hypothetical protein
MKVSRMDKTIRIYTSLHEMKADEYRTGKAVPTRRVRPSGRPPGFAGVAFSLKAGSPDPKRIRRHEA